MIDIDVPTGVSETALFTAWQRHNEGLRDDALFHDPVAGHLIAFLADTPMHAKIQALSAMTKFPQYFVVRTRYFDDRILDALADGTRQIVTLGAGLDGRIVRLGVPADTHWFELDFPVIIDFKRALLERAGARMACHWTPIATDMTQDWIAPLLASGFDPGTPTVWLVEGLLMYLTREDGDTLIERVSGLSAPGSTLLVEHLQALMLEDEGAWHRARVESQGATWLSARNDLPEWLASHGWSATVHAGADAAISHGRTVDRLPASWLAQGRRL